MFLLFNFLHSFIFTFYTLCFPVRVLSRGVNWSVTCDVTQISGPSNVTNVPVLSTNSTNWNVTDWYIRDWNHTSVKSVILRWVCPSSFYEFHKLKRHRLIHSGLKPYECRICNTKVSASRFFLWIPVTQTSQTDTFGIETIWVQNL